MKIIYASFLVLGYLLGIAAVYYHSGGCLLTAGFAALAAAVIGGLFWKGN